MADEASPSWLSRQVVFPLVSAAVGATGAAFVHRAWERWLGPSHGVPHPLLADTLGARLVAASLAFLPAPHVVVGPRDLVLGAALGGREGERDGWRYWVAGDRSPSAVIGAYLLAKSGWPTDMVNRGERDAWAPGSGHARGQDLTKVYEGAKRRGWLVTPIFDAAGRQVPEVGGAVDPALGERVAVALECGVVIGGVFTLEPGDYFALGDGETVGVVVEVGDGDRTRHVVTVEGGTRTAPAGGGLEPCARWQTRVFANDGTFTLYGAPAAGDRLAWVARPT
jgi:hypothetical protein